MISHLRLPTVSEEVAHFENTLCGAISKKLSELLQGIYETWSAWLSPVLENPGSPKLSWKVLENPRILLFL